MVTADALVLHTQHGHGACLTSRGTHYVAVVKKNHPGRYAQVRKGPGGTSRSGTALAMPHLLAAACMRARPRGTRKSD